jgi:hypothetical protein
MMTDMIIDIGAETFPPRYSAARTVQEGPDRWAASDKCSRL